MNPADDDTDPWLWLEEVQGERALAWVRERNARTRARLEAWPGFEATRRRILDVLDARDRIPAIARRGDFVYNFWQDAEHPRGLWRRTTLDDYRQRDAGLGHRARPRCAGCCRRRELGLGRRGLPGPRLHALPAALVARRCRCAGAARVRPRHAALRRRRLPAARGQERSRLGRPRHALRGQRFRPRLADRFGLPARHQALAARPAAGRCGDGVRGSARRCRRQRACRSHPRLRAHRVHARAGLLQQRGCAARRRRAAAAAQTGRRATALLVRPGAAGAAQRLAAGRHALAQRRAAGQRCPGLPGGPAAMASPVHTHRHALAGRLRAAAPHRAAGSAGQRGRAHRRAAVRRPGLAGARGAGALPLHAGGAEPARPAGGRRCAGPRTTC